MKGETWLAIAQRQANYKLALTRICTHWTEERVAACTDMRKLRWLAGLSDRVERHQQRMARHAARSLEALPDPPATESRH